MQLIAMFVLFVVMRRYYFAFGKHPTRLYLFTWFLLWLGWAIVLDKAAINPYWNLLIPPLLVLTIPSVFLVLITEPMGWVWPSYALGRCALFVYRRDRKGGALFSAAKAWKNSRRLETVQNRILTKLHKGHTIMGGSVVASALMNYGRLDDDVVYSQFESLSYTPSLYYTPARCLRTAFLWFFAYESERNNWHHIIRWHKSLIGNMFWIRGGFLLAAAQRLQNPQIQGKPWRLSLWYFLSLSFRLKDLYESARLASPLDVPEICHEENAGEASFKEAVAKIKALVFSDHRSWRQADVHAVGRYWDALFSSASARQQLSERLTQLGGGDLTRLLRLLEDNLRLELSVVLQRLPSDGYLDDSSQLVSAIEEEDRDGLFAQLEFLISTIALRTQEEKCLPADTEWQEWGHLRSVYQRLVKDLSDRHAAFSMVISTTSDWAAWLWNDRCERLLGNAIFAWLACEATQVSEDDLADRMLANMMLPLYGGE